MSHEDTLPQTLKEIRARSPFPWAPHINVGGFGAVKMVDAAGFEVPLLSIVALANIVTKGLPKEEAT